MPLVEVGTVRIANLYPVDLRFPLPAGVGSDALHTNPVYSFATCIMQSDSGLTGSGFSLTLGAGTDLVCAAIGYYATTLRDAEVAEVMEGLGTWWRRLANDGQFRWLGPQKGVVHLALAAVVGAVVDLWAQEQQLPLWQALLEMPSEALLNLIDFSTIEDYLPRDEALDLLNKHALSQSERDEQIARGYPAYDTSVGWLGYDIAELQRNVVAARARGFQAVKVKVGLPDLATDLARLAAVRQAVGDDTLVMIDANQRWGTSDAIRAGRSLAAYSPFWFEEPVHPDDLTGYVTVRSALAPMQIAGGEHIPNQVVFKNFFQSGALDIAQPDVVRLGGLPEYLAVALMAAKAGAVVLPHAGDMGQIHQHLIYFSRCRLGMRELPLEMIPHLAEHFAEPCVVRDGRYLAPRTPGSSSRLRPDTIRRFARGVAREIETIADVLEAG